MSVRQKPPLFLHDQLCTYMTLLIISTGDFMLSEDCLVTNLDQTLGLNTAPQLGTINSAPRFCLGLLDSEAQYWIMWGRLCPKLLAKYSNVKNKGLNYFCWWKVLSLRAKLWGSCSPSPLVLAPSPKPDGSSWVSLKPQIRGLGRTVRLICWEASGCTVPCIRFSKLITLIGALRFLKPAMLHMFASSLAEPGLSAGWDPLRP